MNTIAVETQSPSAAGRSPNPQGYLSKYGPSLIENGLRIVPIEKGEKRPLGGPDGVGWVSFDADDRMLRGWIAKGYGANGVGVLTRDNPAVDVDIRDEAMAETVADWCRRNIGATPLRIGNAPKRLLVYRTDEPFKKVTSNTYRSPDGETHQIEILADGEQFVAYDTHKDTGRPYTWPDDDLIDFHSDLLPTLTKEKARELIAWFESVVPTDWTLADKGRQKGERISGNPNKKLAQRRMESLLPHLTNEGLGYDAWSDRGHAFKAATEDYPEVGRQMFHDFSAQCEEKYQVDETDRLWDSIKGVTSIGGGTLVRLAKEAGWEDESAGAAEDFGRWKDTAARVAAERPQRRILSYDEMAAMPEPEWLVEGVIQKRSAALAFGKSNTFKSFLAIDIGLSVATGRPWHGREVAPGHVLFVITEGANGVGRLRVPGWLNHHEIPVAARQGVHLLPSEVSLDVKTDVDWLINEVRKIGPIDLIVLDIFGGTMSGTEVEDTTARAWVRAVQRIIAETGASVLTVAHTGWSDDTRARMHTHFWGSFDSRLRVDGDKEKLTTCLIVERHKDADSSGSWGFSLRPSQGTLVPEFDESVKADKSQRLPPSQRIAMRALGGAIEAHGEIKEGEDWPQCKVVSIETWQLFCVREGFSDSKDRRVQNQAFKRARASLLERKAIRQRDDLVWDAFDA